MEHAGSLADLDPETQAVDTEVKAVRIGFDMLAVQSPHSGPRGIGRYSASLVSALLARDDDHEYILYVHAGLPAKRIPSSPRAELRPLRPRWEQGEGLAACVDRLAGDNPDGLDVLVVLSPFEHWMGYKIPTRPDNGPRIAVVVYDLIPFLFQNDRDPDPLLMRHYRALQTLTRYDALLAISESTRDDVLALLRLAPERVVNIGAASDPSFFFPNRAMPAPASVQRTLAGLRIDRPFVLNVGGLDDRKNLWRLLDAFAALPAHLRESHQLVLTFLLNSYWYYQLMTYAKERGLDRSVVLTGEVSDETLRLLYRRCAAFVFPSLYEGFGLPLLEAMHCGAAVVAGNNSAQIEVVGDAGLLAEAVDSTDIAAKLGAILSDPALAADLGSRATRQAAKFSWEQTAGRALEAITRVESQPARARQPRLDRARRKKPAIAFLSPLPPRKSGVSDYSALLLDELRKTYQIDLFHDRGYVPVPALACDEYTTADYRLFDRIAAARNYHAIVYQMGNSHYHNFLYPIMLRHPGVVTLHDFCLAGFQIHYGHSRGQGLGLIREELNRWYPEAREEIAGALATWGDDGEAIQKACARHGWYLNRGVLEAAQVMVVHSPWCEAQVVAQSPQYADRVVVIPFGIHPRQLTDAQRSGIRDRFHLPQDALVVASFGFVHPDKMCPQALDAFSTVARDDPKALFIFVGEEADGGQVLRHAAELGLGDHVRFLGRQPGEAFDALMNVTDLGVNLRLPPTNGETSAALLNLLASGVATIVTDVATFSDFPATVVRKVRWESEGQDGLRRAFVELATNRSARQALGRAAWSYVDEFHEWSRVARLYVDAIEQCHDERSGSGRDLAGNSTVRRGRWLSIAMT
jgi:glycosyltransferase involved in cell wall biosynthesis